MEEIHDRKPGSFQQHQQHENAAATALGPVELGLLSRKSRVSLATASFPTPWRVWGEDVVVSGKSKIPQYIVRSVTSTTATAKHPRQHGTRTVSQSVLAITTQTTRRCFRMLITHPPPLARCRLQRREQAWSPPSERRPQQAACPLPMGTPVCRSGCPTCAPAQQKSHDYQGRARNTETSSRPNKRQTDGYEHSTGESPLVWRRPCHERELFS